jgi:hypothetical protein
VSQQSLKLEYREVGSSVTRPLKLVQLKSYNTPSEDREKGAFVPRKGYTAERIIPMLRQAEVELGKGRKVDAMSPRFPFYSTG